MPYLIDTDVVIDHLADLPDATELLNRLADDGIAISIITYMETFQGLARSTDPEQAHARFQSFVDSVPVLPLSIAVAERCARLREALRLDGRRISQRALDLIHAATALEHDLIVVARNQSDYRDIPGLQRYSL